MTSPGHKPLVLVAEDDPLVASTLRRTLQDYGFASEHFTAGTQLLRRMQTVAPDLCLIDLGLPDGDGLDLLRAIRARSSCAVIVVTGRDISSERILGLELGADDYVTKPFEPRELIARIRTVLRRTQGTQQTGPAAAPRHATFAGLRYDSATFELTRPDGEAIILSLAEAMMLTTFLNAPNQLLSRDILTGQTQRAPSDRTIDIRISKLRKKLGDDAVHPHIIRTVYGAGYILSAQVVWSGEGG